MTRQALWLITLLSLSGGMFGGFLAGWLDKGDRATAAESPQPAKLIAAEEVRLVDREGRTRARLGLDANDVVGFYVLDREGKERARLGIFDDLAALVLTGTRDDKGSGLTVFQDGRAELTLQAEGKRVHLPSAPARHWVLWGQRMPFEVPIGTWPTQSQCEEHRLERQQALTSWLLSCLPESVEPSRQ